MGSSVPNAAGGQPSAVLVHGRAGSIRDDVELREQRYWDGDAATKTVQAVVQSTRHLEIWDERKLELFGDLRGKRVLDLGCGDGRAALLLAQRGARVSAVDISPASVGLCARAADILSPGGSVKAIVASAHALPFGEAEFDLVHGQDILHHVDVAIVGQQLRRVLKPGGRAVFRENSSRNGLLMLARDHLCGRFGIPKWSSDDEYPLSAEEVREFAGNLGGCATVEYPEFLFFHYFDAKLFGYRNPLVNRMCHWLDGAIHRFAPFLRQYSYHQLILVDRR